VFCFNLSRRFLPPFRISHTQLILLLGPVAIFNRCPLSSPVLYVTYPASLFYPPFVSFSSYVRACFIQLSFFNDVAPCSPFYFLLDFVVFFGLDTAFLSPLRHVSNFDDFGSFLPFLDRPFVPDAFSMNFF